MLAKAILAAASERYTEGLQDHQHISRAQILSGRTSVEVMASAPFRSHTSKMSMEGWWMVQTTVRPVLTVLRTVRITMAAALASRPDVGSSCTPTCVSGRLHDAC